MGEIPHAFPIPIPSDQAGVLSTGLGEIQHALPSPNPFDHGGALPTDSNTLERKNAIDGGVIQVEGSWRCFSLGEVRRATRYFDEAFVIGNGGFGKVYKGIIKDGATTTVVAIKRLNARSKQGAEEFWTEVKFISKFQHTNLVSLIGYCNENQEMILVYPYISRGALANYLYKSSREESCKSEYHLTWHQRLKICLGVARGLNYLHNGTEQHIIHRDVKSTNILLDDNWVAKVSDFGISKCITSQTTTHVCTKVKGTSGYLDPHYFYTNRLTRKSDVYAFGVVLLEVLCGRPVIDTRLEEEQISLILWAQMYIKKGKLDRIIDPSLMEETPPQDSIKYFAELADKCLHTHPRDRPTMAKVVKSLEIALVPNERKVTSWGSIAQGMRSWWRDSGGPSDLTLESCLHGSNIPWERRLEIKSCLHGSNIPWERRLEICINGAGLIEFLHMNVEQQVIHGDIRTSTIFLDNKWEVKIGSFKHSIPIRNGLATKGLETVVRGKDAYLDPESFHRQAVTKKSDVYSFGVVLLEVLCAKTPPNLFGQFYKFLKEGTIVEAMDPYLIGKIEPKCFGFFVFLALSCMADEGIRRPSMDIVLRSLKSLLQLQKAWDNSFQTDAYIRRSYNEIISMDREFTIGGQSFLIYDLVRQWDTISSSFSETLSTNFDSYQSPYIRFPASTS